MMTFSLSANVRKFTNQAISAMLMAVLIASGLGGALPTLLTGSTNAIADTTYDNVSLSSGWGVDRTAPSGGYGLTEHEGRQAMRLGVTPPSTASNSFYQFEGIKKTITPSTTVRADLYVDSSWPINAVRAGLWAEGYNEASEISSYPIIEHNNTVSTNWRIFDSVDGTWREVSVPSAVSGWNKIELAINKTDSTLTDIHVNDVLVGSSVGYTTKALKVIFLNNFNSTTAGAGYNVYWSNLETGVYNPDAPTNLRFARDNGTPVATNSTINYTDVKLHWNTVPGAERYQIKVTAPDNTSQASRQQGWYIFDLSDATRHGHFGTQEGSWTYQVRTKDATTGLWSAYTSPLSLNYDSVAPTVIDEQQVYNAAKNRIDVTLTFNEAVNPTSIGQGWYVVSGSNNTKFTKAYYSSKTHSVSYADTFGNSSTYSLTVDFTKPTAAITSPSVNAVVGGNTLTITGTASDDNFKEYRYYIKDSNGTVVGNNSWSKKGTTAVTNGTLGTWDITNFASDTYTVGMMVYDKNGNSQWAGHKFVIDHTAPASTNDLGALVSGTVTVTQNITDTHSSAASGKLRIWKLDENGNSDNTKFYAIGNVTADANGNVTYSLDTTKLHGDGEYIAKFTATDTAGNAGVASPANYFTVDNTAPEITFNTASLATTDTAPTLNGTTNDAAASVEVTVGTQTYTATVNGNTWSVDVADMLMIGSYAVTATATDAAGNATTEAATLSITSALNLTDGNGVNENLEQPTFRAQTLTSTSSRNSTVGQASTPQVLGASTTTPSTVAAETGDNDVKGVTTTEDDEKKVENSAFLGLGWWWIVVLAAIATVLGYLFLGRRAERS